MNDNLTTRDDRHHESGYVSGLYRSPDEASRAYADLTTRMATRRTTWT